MGFDDSFAQHIADYVRKTIAPDGTIIELADPIVWEEIHAAVRHLPSNKNPGPDLISGEILRVAGLGFEVALTHLFNAIWRAGVWPARWQIATLIPLCKNSGDMSDPHNYRMLAMMNTLPKVFEKVLETRMRRWAERVGVLCDHQGGFRKERSTTDQIFILNELITSRLESKLETYTCFIDVAKAYDRVWRPGLWYKLHNAGLDK